MNGIGLWCHQTLQDMAIERPKSMVAWEISEGDFGGFCCLSLSLSHVWWHRRAYGDLRMWSTRWKDILLTASGNYTATKIHNFSSVNHRTCYGPSKNQSANYEKLWVSQSNNPILIYSYHFLKHLPAFFHGNISSFFMGEFSSIFRLLLLRVGQWGLWSALAGPSAFDLCWDDSALTCIDYAYAHICI